MICFEYVLPSHSVFPKLILFYTCCCLFPTQSVSAISVMLTIEYTEPGSVPGTWQLLNVCWINVEWNTECRAGRQDQTPTVGGIHTEQNRLSIIFSPWAKRQILRESQCRVPGGETQLNNAMAKVSVQMHSHLHLFKRKWGLGLMYVWLSYCVPHTMLKTGLLPHFILMTSLQRGNMIEPSI